MGRLTIVIGGAEMLVSGKSNSSRLFLENLRNPTVRFGGALGERLPNAIDKNSGNGHHLNRGHGESLPAGFLLLDASLRPIYASEEALAILAYPDAVTVGYACRNRASQAYGTFVFVSQKLTAISLKRHTTGGRAATTWSR